MKLISFLVLSLGCLFIIEPVLGQSQTTPDERSSQRIAPAATGSDIYFKAVGDDPTWTLMLSPNGIEFRTEATGYQNFSSPHIEPTKAIDSSIKTYRLKTEAGSMDIELAAMICQNESSHERFTYSVSIALQQGKDTSIHYFNGCGKYITEPDLEFKWVVRQIGPDTVTTAQFNDTLPYLLIYSRANSFEGYGGCNKINGRLFSERNLLRFTNLYLSKRQCETLAREEEFVKALQFSTQFEIIGDRLVLSNYNGVTMILTKVKQ
jgi:heat shock protein HslJ